MSGKTPKELGEEYESASIIIKERIDRKEAALRRLKDSICSNEAYKLKKELKILYEELREAKENAEGMEEETVEAATEEGAE